MASCPFLVLSGLMRHAVFVSGGNIKLKKIHCYEKSYRIFQCLIYSFNLKPCWSDVASKDHNEKIIVSVSSLRSFLMNRCLFLSFQKNHNREFSGIFNWHTYTCVQHIAITLTLTLNFGGFRTIIVARNPNPK